MSTQDDELRVKFVIEKDTFVRDIEQLRSELSNLEAIKKVKVLQTTEVVRHEGTTLNVWAKGRPEGLDELGDVIKRIEALEAGGTRLGGVRLPTLQSEMTFGDLIEKFKKVMEMGSRGEGGWVNLTEDKMDEMRKTMAWVVETGQRVGLEKTLGEMDAKEDKSIMAGLRRTTEHLEYVYRANMHFGRGSGVSEIVGSRRNLMKGLVQKGGFHGGLQLGVKNIYELFGKDAAMEFFMGGTAFGHEKSYVDVAGFIRGKEGESDKASLTEIMLSGSWSEQSYSLGRKGAFALFELFKREKGLNPLIRYGEDFTEKGETTRATDLKGQFKEWAKGQKGRVKLTALTTIAEPGQILGAVRDTAGFLVGEEGLGAFEFEPFRMPDELENDLLKLVRRGASKKEVASVVVNFFTKEENLDLAMELFNPLCNMTREDLKKRLNAMKKTADSVSMPDRGIESNELIRGLGEFLSDELKGTDFRTAAGKDVKNILFGEVGLSGLPFKGGRSELAKLIATEIVKQAREPEPEPVKMVATMEEFKFGLFGFYKQVFTRKKLQSLRKQMIRGIYTNRDLGSHEGLTKGEMISRILLAQEKGEGEKEEEETVAETLQRADIPSLRELKRGGEIDWEQTFGMGGLVGEYDMRAYKAAYNKILTERMMEGEVVNLQKELKKVYGDDAEKLVKQRLWKLMQEGAVPEEKIAKFIPEVLNEMQRVTGLGYEDPWFDLERAIGKALKESNLEKGESATPTLFSYHLNDFHDNVRELEPATTLSLIRFS